MLMRRGAKRKPTARRVLHLQNDFNQPSQLASVIPRIPVLVNPPPPGGGAGVTPYMWVLVNPHSLEGGGQSLQWAVTSQYTEGQQMLF